ncbi:mitochondrial 39-S ribosomal protein L47 (MRP-L47)-domain-containing protein [Podospora australis]|uniref:Large ribosomal subunit protein uL29m n=1 Tax=Podospora australis TaxID=1536484 RepID=A0AAN6X4W8_9PEZI|nr:mitochondrial 39-S ribosomal protein L47 (MRP-L47)-domain-containing protein [Podospora australis]
MASAVRPSVGAVTRLAAPLRQQPQLVVSKIQTAPLSTTATLLKRHKYLGARDNKDHNKKRGESALRRTGTRWRLSMSDEPLPKPVPKSELPAVETDPNHGLWEFFASRTTVAATPEEDAKHGRGWAVEELRHKSWDDLHKLWWVCVKERNRIATGNWERNKSKLGFGESEADRRDREVRITMRGIKHVLTERLYAWEDAVALAKNDPEIDLSGNGPAFTPTQYLEDEPVSAFEVAKTKTASPEATEAEAPAAAAAATPDPATITPAAKPQSEARV